MRPVSSLTRHDDATTRRGLARQENENLIRILKHHARLTHRDNHSQAAIAAAPSTPTRPFPFNDRLWQIRFLGRVQAHDIGPTPEPNERMASQRAGPSLPGAGRGRSGGSSPAAGTRTGHQPGPLPGHGQRWRRPPPAGWPAGISPAGRRPIPGVPQSLGGLFSQTNCPTLTPLRIDPNSLIEVGLSGDQRPSSLAGPHRSNSVPA
jgi:hypothetical protein